MTMLCPPTHTTNSVVFGKTNDQRRPFPKMAPELCWVGVGVTRQGISTITFTEHKENSTDLPGLPLTSSGCGH